MTTHLFNFNSPHKMLMWNYGHFMGINLHIIINSQRMSEAIWTVILKLKVCQEITGLLVWFWQKWNCNFFPPKTPAGFSPPPPSPFPRHLWIYQMVSTGAKLARNVHSENFASLQNARKVNVQASWWPFDAHWPKWGGFIWDITRWSEVQGKRFRHFCTVL